MNETVLLILGSINEHDYIFSANTRSLLNDKLAKLHCGLGSAMLKSGNISDAYDYF